MKCFRLLILLYSLTCFGCGARQAPVEPGIELSKEYQGFLIDKDSRKELIWLYLEQEGTRVKGEFALQSGDRLFGKLDGTAEQGKINLTLRVPLWAVQKFRMSPTLDLELGSGKEDPAEIERLLGEKVPSNFRPLVGSCRYTSYNEEVNSSVVVLDKPFDENIFNKER